MAIVRNAFILALIFSAVAADGLGILAAPIEGVGLLFTTITNASLDAVQVGLNMVDAGIEAGISTTNIISERITKLIEEFRKKMAQNIPELGLPRLEPLTLEHTDIKLNNEVGQINGTLDDVQIENLSLFQIDEGSLHVDLTYKFKINLTFPTLDIHGRYDINGKFGEMFNIFGKGPFNLTMYDVKLGIDSQLQFANAVFSLSRLNLTLSLKKMKCNFVNLMGGGENEKIFNKVIGNIAPEAIHTLWPDIQPIIAEKIKNIFEVSLIPKRILQFRNKFLIRMSQVFPTLG